MSIGRTLQSEAGEPQLVREDDEIMKKVDFGVELNQQELHGSDRQSIPICNCPAP